MKQRLVTVLLIAIIALNGGYYAYQRLVPASKPTRGPVYSTRQVKRGDVSVGVEASGPLNPSRAGGIQAPGRPGPMSGGGVTGYMIDDILVKDGDVVKQGQVLARLRGVELESQIKALSDETGAERKSLADLMGVPLDSIYSVDPSAGITLRAPISGRVTGLTVTEGAELKQGQIVARIVDDSRLRLVAKLTPGEFKRVTKVGQPVVLAFAQYEGFHPARVSDINPSPIPEAVSSLESGLPPAGDSDTGNWAYVYWVTVESENPGLVRPGMLVRVGFVDDHETIFSRYPARVSYVSEERVLNRADAMATRVFVQEMQTVKTGDPLVSLAGQDARDMVQTRLDRLREKELNLAQLQSQLGQLEVRSPIDGVVAEVNKAPGQTVMPGEWFGNVFNTSDMRLWVQVDELDVLLVRPEAPVQVTVDAVPGKVLEGKVNRVNTVGKGEKGISRFAVDIMVKGIPELRPGMQAKAHIDAGSAKDVLLAPVEAIFEEDGKPKVEVLQPDGTTRTVAVELGLMDARVAEIKSGLNEGDLVITGSTADLLPSQRIQSREGLLPENKDSQTNGSGGGNQSGTAPVKP